MGDGDAVRAGVAGGREGDVVEAGVWEEHAPSNTSRTTTDRRLRIESKLEPTARPWFGTDCDADPESLRELADDG